MKLWEGGLGQGRMLGCCFGFEVMLRIRNGSIRILTGKFLTPNL